MQILNLRMSQKTRTLMHFDDPFIESTREFWGTKKATLTLFHSSLNYFINNTSENKEDKTADIIN